ncbi:MAG: AmmeMemoRadiSam system protein B [Deltaproteobacteria bacterium]|nr:AmmeMemoRadiSam system protein B [Deltaproteobacteria bacterium]
MAGSFYPDSGEELEESVRALLEKAEASPALGVISPHAGYTYSGSVAGALFARVGVPDICVMLAPNHTGEGRSPFAVWPDGQWLMPMGRVHVDEEFCGRLLRSCNLAKPDEDAHLREHSIEVQLPFLQAVNPETRIVAITLMHGSYVSAKEMGEHLSKVIKEYGKETLIAVSSDMNHYESEEETNKKDKLAIEEILKLDAEQLMSVTEEKDISMCGVFPAAVAIEASKILGATKARLISHATSGDVSGDKEQVVGYAGFLIK